jgi:enoyl-CoA hydratase
MYENIIVEKLDGGVGLVRLNRPEALNALNVDLMREVIAATAAHEADPEVRCHFITGDDKAFAAGADIKGMADATTVTMLYRDMSMWDHVGALTKPVIAAVSGFALGGGCELALACDIIIASESAKFGQPEINIGVMPGAGGTQRLTRVVGKHIAMEMVLNNRWLKADEALRYGLANHVFPLESYFDEALRIAGEIAARAPVAVRLAKEAINQSQEAGLSAGIKFERRGFNMLFATEDQQEGMDAFVNKRDPNWKGQ